MKFPISSFLMNVFSMVNDGREIFSEGINKNKTKDNFDRNFNITVKHIRSTINMKLKT